MNLSLRTKLSLCQLLILFERGQLVLLLEKHGISTEEIEGRWPAESAALAVRQAVLQASAFDLGELVQELTRTRRSMRNSVNPRYRFDEHWDDLQRCLELDGYRQERDEYNRKLDHFVPIEPTIDGGEVPEDDLTRELCCSNLSKTEEILRILESSADAFRGEDFNACLGNARVALQTLARSIAQARLPNHPGNFDIEKWGQVLAYLRTSGFIDAHQEHGISGVFDFVSPGAHTPIGLSEREFARLGRALVVSFCYFLAKRLNAGD